MYERGLRVDHAIGYVEKRVWTFIHLTLLFIMVAALVVHSDYLRAWVPLWELMAFLAGVAIVGLLLYILWIME